MLFKQVFHIMRCKDIFSFYLILNFKRNIYVRFYDLGMVLIEKRHGFVYLFDADAAN